MALAAEFTFKGLCCAKKPASHHREDFARMTGSGSMIMLRK
jgi:hypothetical protein